MVSPRDWRFYAAFSGLMTVNLMAALEASSLAVALPVRFTAHPRSPEMMEANIELWLHQDHNKDATRLCHSRLLVRHWIFAGLNGVPATIRLLLPHLWPQATAFGCIDPLHDRLARCWLRTQFYYLAHRPMFPRRGWRRNHCADQRSAHWFGSIKGTWEMVRFNQRHVGNWQCRRPSNWGCFGAKGFMGELESVW
jgi:hypothetical protein